MGRTQLVPSYQVPNGKRRYTTSTNEAGQLVHTTWRVWRGGEYGTGYKSFLDEDEAW